MAKSYLAGRISQGHLSKCPRQLEVAVTESGVRYSIQLSLKDSEMALLSPGSVMKQESEAGPGSRTRQGRCQQGIQTS